MNRMKLLEVLDKARLGLASGDVIDQTTCFVFEKDKVLTYNDEVSVFCPLEGLDVEGGVKGVELYKLLEKTTGDEVQISVKDSKLVLTKDNMRAELLMEKEITLPSMDFEKFEWSSLPNDFIMGVNFCLFSCSTDMTRPVLSCVYVNKEKGVIESTNNHRLSQFKLSGDIASSFLLPSVSARKLVHYEVGEIAFSEGWVHFKTDDGCIFSIRTYGGKFPNTDVVVNYFREGNVTDKVYFPKDLESVLDRAMIFSKSGDETVRLVFKGGKLTVQAEGEVGYFEEGMNTEYKGKEFSFLINPSYLCDICTKTDYFQVIEDSMVKFEGDNWVHVIALIKA